MKDTAHTNPFLQIFLISTTKAAFRSLLPQTLLEVLVKPLRGGQTGIAKQYRDILTNAQGIEIIDFTTAIAEQAALLRTKYNLITPDAIQLATSIEAKADYCLTNDNRLKLVSETAVLMVSELQ